MPKQTWYIAAILSLLVVLAFVGLTSWQRISEVEKARAVAVQSHAAAEKAAAAAQEKLAEREALVAQLEQERLAATTAQKSLEEQMRASLQSKDITISQLQGKLTVNILDRILFDSGDSQLKPEGEQVLAKIAGVLSQFPNRQIHVVGHTDDVPLSAALRQRFASNWELSTARATAAVRFLQETANVDPRRLGAVGYGEYHPIASNATAEGRAQNRRIALVVLPEELAGADVPPAPAGDKPKPVSSAPVTPSRAVGGAPGVAPAPSPAPTLPPAPAPTSSGVQGGVGGVAANPANPANPAGVAVPSAPALRPGPAIVEPPQPVPPVEPVKRNP